MCKDYCISVIMPVYNAEEYLETSLKSIREQTLKSVEIICVDDGSHDDSVSIIMKMMTTDQDLRLFRQKHSGAGNARNLGIEKAKGEYVAFLDADDRFYDTHALEKMYKACVKNHMKICGSYRKDLFYEKLIDSALLSDIFVDSPEGKKISFDEFQNDYDYQSFIFERDFLIRNDITFPPYLRYQDPPFFLKALLQAKEFWVVPVFLYCYRMGGQSLESLASKIRYVLMGIRDNLQIAVNGNYIKLYSRIIDRLNSEYAEAILVGYSEEVEAILDEINDINSKYRNRRDIKVLRLLSEMQNNRNIWGNLLATRAELSDQNSSFAIYRNTALLNSTGRDIGDVLLRQGISEVSIYGFGEIGEMTYREIGKKVRIEHVYDAGKEGHLIEEGKVIESPDMLNSFSDEIILITPASACQAISYSLICKGIKRERLVALNTVLTIGRNYIDREFALKDKKQFLITGAQFHNKGAQAMLFVAIDEIRKRFPESIIWYLPIDDPASYSKEIQKKYKFLFLLDGYELHSQLFEIANGLTAIIDVSGYALSSYWRNEWYMNTLRLAYNYNIPLYLMPQSFGPFEFDENRDRELKKLLPHVRVIFAREQQGYEELISRYQLTNVRKAKDLVLQNRGVDETNIYNFSRCGDYFLNTEKNIALIPNVRICEFSSEKSALELYQNIVEKLLHMGKDIYVIPHSDDEHLCQSIKALFKDNRQVHLYDKDMDCLEFGDFLKNFDYVISSRFHAIVHAFKKGIPCIGIGWADKYNDLMALFGQERYCMDIRKGIDQSKMSILLDKMDENWEKEQIEILRYLPDVQKENCFSVLDDFN